MVPFPYGTRGPRDPQRDMNELLLFLIAAVSLSFVLIGWRFGKGRLYSVMIVFLILIAAAGGKIVMFFGHETNTGNIFYASVFLATYFLIERYGKREGVHSVFVGIIWVLFFAVLMFFTVSLAGSPSTAALNSALSAAFSPVSRIAFASLVSYAICQSINVSLYLYLKERFAGSHLWLRANLSNLVAQTFDCVIFFTIAFWGVVAPPNIWDIILTGLAIKVVYMALASCTLYLNKVEEEEDVDGVSTVLMRV